MCNKSDMMPGFGISTDSAEPVLFQGRQSHQNRAQQKKPEPAQVRLQHFHFIQAHLLHGCRDIAAWLKSDDHSRQERGGLGDRGGVMDIHAQVVGHMVWTECGCSCANVFLFISSNQANVQQVLPKEHLEDGLYSFEQRTGKSIRNGFQINKSLHLPTFSYKVHQQLYSQALQTGSTFAGCPKPLHTSQRSHKLGQVMVGGLQEVDTSVVGEKRFHLSARCG